MPRRLPFLALAVLIFATSTADAQVITTPTADINRARRFVVYLSVYVPNQGYDWVRDWEENTLDGAYQHVYDWHPFRRELTCLSEARANTFRICVEEVMSWPIDRGQFPAPPPVCQPVCPQPCPKPCERPRLFARFRR